MADTKLTGLTANTAPVSTDVTYIVDDPGGSALSQKTTLANLGKGLDAGVIPNTPAGAIAATNIQAAIDELESEKSPLAGSSNIVTLGTVTTGAWNGTEIAIANGGTGSTTLAGASIPTYTSTNTFTNKRITSRLVTTTDDATAVIDIDTTDVYELSAIANATEFTLTGTPTDGQKLIVRFKDAGVTKGLTWTGFTAIGVTLPTDTTAGKWHYVGCIYNLAATQWQAIAVSEEA